MNIQIKSNARCIYDRLGLLVGAAVLSILVPVGPDCFAASRYVGVRAGLSDAGRDGNLGTQAKGGAGELFGGLRLDEHWAIELGFFGTDLDMGELPYFPDTTRDNDLKLRTTTLSARYVLPLGEQARVHLRGGIASFDLDYLARFRFPTEPGSPLDPADGGVNIYDNNIGSVLAVGVDTAIGQRWRAGIELQHYRGDFKVGDDHGFSVDQGFNRKGSLQVAMLSLSAEF